MIRLDYQASDAHRLTLRIIHDNYDLDRPVRHVHRRRELAADHPHQPRRARAATTRSATPGRSLRTWSTSSRPTARGTASASRPTATPGSATPTASRFRSSSTAAAASRTASRTTTIQGYATFYGAARSLISPTTDIQFSDNLTWLKGAHTLKFGAMVIRNRKDQNGRTPLRGGPRLQHQRQHADHGQRVRRRAARQLPHATRSAATTRWASSASGRGRPSSPTTGACRAT